MSGSEFTDILRQQPSDIDGINPPQLPANWVGESYNPALPFDLATVEAAIVNQLRRFLLAALGPQMIEVAHFPDKPEAYELHHRIGAAIVKYAGSTYETINDIGHVVQERELLWDVGLRIRDLGWAFGGLASGTSPGAYQIIELTRMALLGFRPAPGCTRIRAVHDRFLNRDTQGGMWTYEFRFGTRTVAVANCQQLNAPLFLTGTALEDSGQTPIQVATALLTFTGSPGSITLDQQNISTLVVKSLNLATTYLRNTDYLLDNVNGIISRITTGNIPAAATVAVSYAYSDAVTALAGGGTVPLTPNN
jgi:Gp37 protein